MIECMDRGIARVLDALDRSGLADNTIVMFSSDNGPQFGGKGEMCTDRFNCGFAGSKLLVYEGGIRLPMVMRWPAGLDGRRQVHDMIHFTDWLPTLLALAGAEPPRDLKLDGINVMPTLQGDRGKVPTERFWQWNRYTPDAECNAAMRDGRWKLVRPAIRELMQVSNEDLAMDIQSKYNPENFHDISHAPEPDAHQTSPTPRATLRHRQRPLRTQRPRREGTRPRLANDQRTGVMVRRHRARPPHNSRPFLTSPCPRGGRNYADAAGFLRRGEVTHGRTV